MTDEEIINTSIGTGIVFLTIAFFAGMVIVGNPNPDGVILRSEAIYVAICAGAVAVAAFINAIVHSDD